MHLLFNIDRIGILQTWQMFFNKKEVSIILQTVSGEMIVFIQINLDPFAEHKTNTHYPLNMYYVNAESI